MTSLIVDAGPLVAAINSRDQHHRWACELFQSLPPPLDTCEAVLCETAFLLRAIGAGPRQVTRMVREGAIRVTFRLESEIEAIEHLLAKYESVPMSLADACLVRMSELASRSAVVTLDSDFRIYRRRGRQAIPILAPE